MSVRTLLCGSLASFLIVAGLAAQDVRDTIGPIEKQSHPITPENPIPRRTFSVPAIYPAEASGISASGAVALVATVDDAGRVVEIRKAREPLALSPSTSNPAAVRMAADAMLRESASALRRWTYDPPADGPITFQVSFAFKPGADVTTTQTTTVPGVLIASASGNITGGSAAAGGAMPVRVGGNIKAPVQISKVAPVYPLIAQSARVSGVVILETTIGVTGTVTDVRVLRSVPLLDQAAIDAVRQWLYEPTFLNGVPTPVIMTVTVTFTLPEPQPTR
jgi:TonB family protein